MEIDHYPDEGGTVKMTYRASIEYGPDTLRRLNAVISSTFRTGLKRIYLAICVGLICAGAAIGLQQPKGVALICIACFLLPSVRALESSRAEQAIRRMKGQTLKVEYLFGPDNFVCTGAGEQNEFSYASIIRLVREEEYFYLFPNAGQAYMVAAASLEPADKEAFEIFLAEKVGLQWTKRVSLLTMNLRQLRFNRKNTRLRR